MNKRPAILLGIAAILFVSLCSALPVTSLAGTTDTGDLIVVEKYLEALVTGDIGGLKSLLSPGLLQKKAPVLDSPSYDDVLRSRYKNATFQIVGASSVAADRVKVDTEIILDSGRSMEASFIIVCDADGNCLIDEEVE